MSHKSLSAWQAFLSRDSGAFSASSDWLSQKPVGLAGISVKTATIESLKGGA